MRPDAARAAMLEASCALSRAELVPLARELVELHVQPQHGDVQRDDACEQHGDEDDPDDAARDAAPRRRFAARAASGLARGLVRAGAGWLGRPPRRAIYAF